MNFIKKLQNKPKQERKIILWTIIIILALTLGSLWIYNSYKNIKKLKEQNILKNINLPEVNIPEELKQIPNG